MKRILTILTLLSFPLIVSSCNTANNASSASNIASATNSTNITDSNSNITNNNSNDLDTSDIDDSSPIEINTNATKYVDSNGDVAYIPADFVISEEQTINTGLVVIAPDNSEYVWVPTTKTEFKTYDFGSYFSSGDNFSNYYDEVGLDSYQQMKKSVETYGGFYMGRYEASKGNNNRPLSVEVSNEKPGNIWVQFSPQDTVGVCASLYADNDSVQGFFPWGINYDTTLQWLIDSKAKTREEVVSDSSSWGNYSNDLFSSGAKGNYTGTFEEAKANNIYDLAGNNWEWTQERNGTNYVMRGGGYNLMGGDCSGSRYPAALRDPLPGNDHHPNVTFRIGLYIL